MTKQKRVTVKPSQDPATFAAQMMALKQSVEMDRTASYLRRGREFAALDNEALDALWVETDDAWTASLLEGPGPELSTRYFDLVSEYRLRERIPPHQSGPDLDAKLAGLAERLQGLPRTDPGRYAHAVEDSAALFRRFKNALKS